MTLSGKMMLNGEGTILSLSDNLQEYFSLRIPVSLKTLIDWERSPFQTFHECMNTLKRGEHVYLFFKKRKTASVLFLVMIQQKREEKGNITLMLQHIPHERQLEIELRQQKRYTNEIISMANIVFIRTDARYCIKDMNPWAEKVLHLHKQERINQHIFDVLQIKTSDREKVRILLKEKGQCQDLEITYHTPDGEEKTLLWNIKLLIDFQYGQSVLLFFGHDITERTRLKTQMAQSEKLAALGQLAGGIAHDISKPLVSMSSLIQMLQATVLDDSMESTLKVINQQIDYLSKTLRQLVDLSKPLHGEKEIININTLLEDALRIVRFDTYLRNIHIIYESPTEKAVVCSVYDQLLQVFINIFLNAGYAMRQCDTPVLRIRTNMNDEHITILITDNGEGISEENIDRVFEPFFTTRSSGQGTGLGLWVCYQIVAAMGGKIWIESDLQRGTTVGITLPVLKGGEDVIKNTLGR